VICRLTGRVTAVSEEALVLEQGGVSYEILVPASAIPELHGRIDQELTVFTILYLEGNPAASHLIPRLIGFLTQADRDFFNIFTKVRGISMRKGLRAMSAPADQLAAAIEQGDVRLLTSLPEIGKKTAEHIISDLRGKLAAFQTPSTAPLPSTRLSDTQRIAVEILVQWGDRRADAEHWVAAAVDANPNLKKPEDIIRAAYAAKESRAVR